MKKSLAWQWEHNIKPGIYLTLIAIIPGALFLIPIWVIAHFLRKFW